MDRKRVRECRILIGRMEPGKNNAITDVAGVRVGHATILNEGLAPLSPGKGPARTGVTVILPHAEDIYMKKVRAAVHTINGHGKVHGYEQVRELGTIETPIALTGTFNVGLVSDALIQYMTEQNPEIGTTDDCLSLNVLVGETNDGYLNDMTARFVRYEHVTEAINQAKASGDFSPVQEGAVGAGTGTHTYGWKGGIGTASRKLPDHAGGFSVGVLVQSNFGLPEQLTIKGIPVGQHIQPENRSWVESRLADRADKGSIMIVVATDAPLSERQLERLCKRAPVGLARTGSHIGHQSGDFVISFSTQNIIEHKPTSLIAAKEMLVNDDVVMPWLFQAVVESTEEAILNALFKAVTVAGRAGHIRYQLPADKVLELMQEISVIE